MLSLSSPLSLGFSAPTLAPASRAAVRMQEGGFQDAATVAAAAEKAAGQGEFCYGLPGNIVPVENFDPFNLLEGKTFEQVRTWREAELAHCRVGMLAATGFLVQEKFHPLFSGDGGPAIEQIPKLPVWLWVVMGSGIAAAESYRINVAFRELDGEKLKAETAP